MRSNVAAALATTALTSLPASDHATGVADTPELRLRAALLDQAGADLATYWGACDPIGARRWRDARAWIDRVDRCYPFSFVNVCEALGFAPARVRAHLRHAATVAAATRGDAAPRLRRA